MGRNDDGDFSMYTPTAFAESDLSLLDALVARDSFATVVTVRGVEPTVSHLPLLYQREGERIELRGHWARPNPQASHAGAALIILQGAHAYVSPSWYPDKEEQSRVPTWNYAVAHLHGQLELRHDDEFLARVVSDLSDLHEASVGRDWRFEHERAAHQAMLRGIVGFRFQVERTLLKFKLSQNHPQANRVAVAQALCALPREGSREIGAMMQTRETLRG